MRHLRGFCTRTWMNEPLVVPSTETLWLAASQCWPGKQPSVAGKHLTTTSGPRKKQGRSVHGPRRPFSAADVASTSESSIWLAPKPQRSSTSTPGRTLSSSTESKPPDFLAKTATSERQEQVLFGKPWTSTTVRPGFMVPKTGYEWRKQAPISSKKDLSPLIQAVLQSLKDFKFDASKDDSRQTKINRRKFFPKHHKQVSTGDPRYDALARTLCRILRHQAVELHMMVRADGYVRMDELLNLRIPTHAGIPMNAHSVEEVLEIVNKDPKRRYSTVVEDGCLYVRANQGHSMTVVRSEKLLTEIVSPEQAPVCVHGTFKCYWPSIARSGLNRMGRNHVHFATGLPNEEGVLSGMEDSCEVLIYLDVPKALRDGMKIYMSENRVLLTEGFGGVVGCEYFLKVVEWPSGLPMRPFTGSTLGHADQTMKYI